MVVENGNQALLALEREPFDLALIDIQMPELDGLETAEMIRAWDGESETFRDGRVSWRRAAAHLPLIALTANAMMGDRERCLDAGMSDYLAKPFMPEQLYALLKKWLPAGEMSNVKG